MRGTVVAFYVEDADLEQRPVCDWADEHYQGSSSRSIRLIALLLAVASEPVVFKSRVSCLDDP